MATYNDLELWAVVSAIYYDRNEIITYPTGETRGHVHEAVTGLQAELLHTESIEGLEDVGQPEEVFITPRDILESTTYTELGTVRRRLDELVDDGLLDVHGDLTSNPEEVARFVSDTFEWSNQVRQQATAADAGSAIKDQRQKVIEDLSDEQLSSVQEVLRDVDLTVKDQSTSDLKEGSPTDADVSPSSCNNYGDSVAAYVQVPYVGDTLHAFTFEIDIGWCVDMDEVINVSPSTIGNAQGYVLVNWDYQGVSDESLTFHPDRYYAISYQKGKYNRCIIASSGVSCVATDYGWIEAVVYNDRSGRTTEKGADG